MIHLELRVELTYDVQDSNGADFVFNVHAAHTAHQTVVDESLVLEQPVRRTLEPIWRPGHASCACTPTPGRWD